MKNPYKVRRDYYTLARLLIFIIHEYYLYYSYPMPSLKFTNQQMRALAGEDNELTDDEVKWINEILSDDDLILLKFKSFWILAPCHTKGSISMPPGLLRNFYAGYADVYFETDEDEAADDDEDEAA
jgi:hypothetical protein